MSQFRTEVLPFPWIPLVVIVLGIALVYLIGKWISEFARWMWYNRPAEKNRSNSDSEEETKRDKKRGSSGKKRSSKRRDDSGSESD